MTSTIKGVETEVYVSPMIDFLVNHFNNNTDLSDRKMALRQIKAIWICIYPSEESPVVFDLILTKK